MNEPDTIDSRAESLVRDFYRQQSLSEDRVDAILDTATLNVQIRRWKQLAIASSVGLAVMSLIAFGLWSRSMLRIGPSSAGPMNPGSIVDRSAEFPANSGIGMPDVAVDPSRVQTIPDVEQNPQQTAIEAPPYLLVAFQSHGDGCPFCRETGKSYRELEQTLDSDLVQFEQFHLADPNASQENKARIDTYQLNGLIAGRTETAFLALTDRTGDVLRQFNPSLGGAEIAGQVTEVLATYDGGSGQ